MEPQTLRSEIGKSCICEMSACGDLVCNNSSNLTGHGEMRVLFRFHHFDLLQIKVLVIFSCDARQLVIGMHIRLYMAFAR